MEKPDEYTKADEVYQSYPGNNPVQYTTSVYNTAPTYSQRSFRDTLASKLLLFSLVVVILTFAVTFLPTYFVMNSKINSSQQPQSLPNSQNVSITNNATCSTNDTAAFPFNYSPVGPVFTPNNQNCSGINVYWDIGNCKQVTDVNWSFGLNVTTNYSILKIYSDAYCLSAITSLLFTTGCTSGQSVLNVHPQGFKSMKVCHSLTDC